MNIGICDDITKQREKVRRYCDEVAGKLGIDIEFSIFSSGEQVLRSSKRLDLLFLDIEMNGQDGVEVMKRLLISEKVWKIVFVSSHEERIYDTFSLKTLGFIKKPVSCSEVEKWLNVAYNELKPYEFIKFKTEYGTKIINSEYILYMQGERNSVSVASMHIEDVFMASGNMKTWEEKLNQSGIIRVHKSYMVNMMYIEDIRDGIHLRNRKEIIPVGRKYEKLVKESYNRYIYDKIRFRVG